MEFYKKSKSPIWTLFEKSPELFIEVKGEWSLSKITGLIHSKGIHLDVDLSSKYYLLTKEATEKKNHIEEYNFFGYKKYPKNWKVEDEEVQSIKLIVKNHLRKIFNDDYFLYPQIQSFHYPKISNIKLICLEDVLFEEENDFFNFSFNLDEIIEDMEKAENLLLLSTSGHDFFKVKVDEGDQDTFITEKDIKDKTPGKILTHREKDGDLELLMKWKYLSYDESTWIKKEQYQHLYVVKMYCLKNLNNK